MKAFVNAIALVLMNACGPINQDRLNWAYVTDAGCLKLYSSFPCNKADSVAEADIKNGVPCLILEAGMGKGESLLDADFREEFGVGYFSQGCFGMQESCEWTYNKRIFQFLTNKHGEKWLEGVREDVAGLDKWKATL